MQEVQLRQKRPTPMQYRASDDLANDVPVLNNFDNIANDLDNIQDNTNDLDKAGDDFYWNFDDEPMKNPGILVQKKSNEVPKRSRNVSKGP